MADYLTNKELHKELIVCQNRGEFSRTLYKMCKKMIDNYSSKFSYKDEFIREECKSFAIEKCYVSYHKYDPDRGNAFTFITQVIKTAFYYEFNRQIGSKIITERGVKSVRKLETINFSRLFEGGQNNII